MHCKQPCHQDHDTLHPPSNFHRQEGSLRPSSPPVPSFRVPPAVSPRPPALELSSRPNAVNPSRVGLHGRSALASRLLGAKNAQPRPICCYSKPVRTDRACANPLGPAPTCGPHPAFQCTVPTPFPQQKKFASQPVASSRRPRAALHSTPRTKSNCNREAQGRP